MEFQGAKSLPKRCIFPSCRKKLKREFVLGVVPFSTTMVGVLYHCHDCGKIYSFMMPAVLVSQFAQSLPQAPEVLDKRGGRKMDGREITMREIGESVKEIRADGKGILDKFREIEEQAGWKPEEEE